MNVTTVCGTRSARVGRRHAARRDGGRALWAVALSLLSLAPASSALATPNTGKAWGWNAHGELGDGSIGGPEECAPFKEACSTHPLAITGLIGARKVSGGSKHALALLEGGTVVAWGGNGAGELGDGTTEPSGLPVGVCEVGYAGPVPCPPGHLLTGVTDVAAGGGFSVATLASGTVVAWGEIAFAQLGDDTTKQSDVPVVVCEIGYSGPAPCASEHHLSGATAVAAGESFALARLESGEVAAWGANTLGDGSEAGSGVPVAVSGLGGVTAVAARQSDGYALTGGKVMSWGQNAEGELGNGTETSSDVPVEVSGVSGVTAIAAGGGGALALLKSSGKVMAWGQNGEGELGDGTSSGPEMCRVPPTAACAKEPVEVSGLSGISTMSAGSNFGLALRADGTLAVWGGNGLGQLATGSNIGPEACRTEACSTKPLAVSGLADAKGIGASAFSDYAFGPPPAVTQVSPKKGVADQIVGITGTDFTGASEVKFGATPATNFEVLSATFMFATVPSEPVGKADVTVTNDWGTSAISSADQFSLLPSVTSVSPNGGQVAGGTTVTIKGSGFSTGAGATKFSFRGRRATSVNCSSTSECTMLSPPHAAGTVDVHAIVDKLRSRVNRPADQFTYS